PPWPFSPGSAGSSNTSVVPPNSSSHSAGGSSSASGSSSTGAGASAARSAGLVHGGLLVAAVGGAAFRRSRPGPGRAAGGLDAGQLEDELHDVGLTGTRRGLGAERLGDGRELLTVLALESGPFEGGWLHAHRWLSPHCLEGETGLVGQCAGACTRASRLWASR